MCATTISANRIDVVIKYALTGPSESVPSRESTAPARRRKGTSSTSDVSGHEQHVGHAIERCAIDAHLAVIRPAQHQRENWIERFRTGNHAQLECRRRQL